MISLIVSASESRVVTGKYVFLKIPFMLVTLGVLSSQISCATTPDFVDLKEEVKYIHKQQSTLKTQFSELQEIIRVFVEEQKKEVPEYLGARLDELNTTFEEMIETQAELDIRVSNLREGMPVIQSKPSAVSQGVDDSSQSGKVLKSSKAEAGSQKFTSPCLASAMPVVEPDIQVPIAMQDTAEAETSMSPQEAFEIAYQDYQVGLYDSAIEGFKRFKRKFPGTTEAVSIQYLLGTAYFRKGDCVNAIVAYETMIDRFPHNTKSALALWKLSSLYDAAGNNSKARAVLLQLIDRHPKTKEAKLARRKLPDLSQ